MTVTAHSFDRLPGDVGRYVFGDPEGAVRLCRHAPFVAMDIETGSAKTVARWKMSAFSVGDSTTAHVLDPADAGHRAAIRDCIKVSRAVVFHNAPYDVPILYLAGLMDVDDIDKVQDTLVTCRIAWPDSRTHSNSLGQAASRVLGGNYAELKDSMAAGFRAVTNMSKTAMFNTLGISSPAFVAYSAFDVLTTARLYAALPKVLEEQLNPGLPSMRPADSTYLEEREQTVNRMLMKRTSVGIDMDLDAVDSVVDELRDEAAQCRAVLVAEGVDPDLPATQLKQSLLARFDAKGMIPGAWPRLRDGVTLSTSQTWMRQFEEVPAVDAATRMLRAERYAKDYSEGSLNMTYMDRIHAQANIQTAVTGRMCLPDSHRLLTRSGPVKVDDIQAGDQTLDASGNWTTVTAVHRYRDAEVVSVSSTKHSLDSTREHRWVQESEHLRRRTVEPIAAGSRASVVLSPFDEVPLWSDLAGSDHAILGLLVTDGRVATADGLRSYIYQTERKFYRDIMDVLPAEAVMYDRVTTGDHHEIRLRAGWVRAILARLGLDAPEVGTLADMDLVPLLLRSTHEEVADFLHAAMLADGAVGTGRISCGRESLRNALQVAGYLCGWASFTRWTGQSGWATKPRAEVSFRPATFGLRKTIESTYTSDVWCVTTESGTFTAWGDGPYLTGNSYSGPNLQQFPGAVRRMFKFDAPATSFDWSSIEPVVVANIARDVETLAAFEAGGDLYIPIADQAGVTRKVAKVVLLAQLYGQGAAGLALRLGVTEDRAWQIIRAIRAALPKIMALINRVRAYGDKHGAIQTISGRVLPLPLDYRSGNTSYTGYKGSNYLVQGSAYDMLAEALYAMHQQGLDDALYLAIHDELVVATEAADDVERIMLTPPWALIAAAGRTPVLRVGRTSLGLHWEAKA